MTTNELITELRANNIKDGVCLILPAAAVEGALCLLKADDDPWHVVLNERGEYLIKETFQSEHDACRFFLKKALLEPTYRKDFTPAVLQTWALKQKQILAQYGFDSEK
jgi:hypothetical protein